MIKNDFKDWLLKQKLNPKTVSAYVRSIQKISDRYFPEANKNNLDALTENIIPLLIKYQELSNREYYLDRITIGRAVKYFDTIWNTLFYKTNINPKAQVKLSIYDGKDYYPVCDTNFKELPLDLERIITYFYEDQLLWENPNRNTVKSKITKDLSHDIIEKILSKTEPLDTKDIAVHVSYNIKGILNEKTALTQYCCFLKDVRSTPNYLDSEIMQLVTRKNPNETISGNYEIVQPLTGDTPQKVALKDEEILYYHDDRTIADFILVKKDLAQIFNLDLKTVKKYFLQKSKIDKMSVDVLKIKKEYALTWEDIHLTYKSTVLRDYFSLDSTNALLKKGLKKIKEQHPGVDYSRQGYKYWVTRLEATQFLKISHNAFLNSVNGSNCSRVEYIPGYSKYYAPDIEYLSTTTIIKRAVKRKQKYINNK